MTRLSALAIVFVAALGIGVETQTIRPQLLGIGQTTLTGADAFFDDTVLHEIRLDINSRDWQSLKDHFLENTYYPCDFRWRDQVVRYIGIRSRGHGSRSGVKPGLRIDFNRYTSGQTFVGLKSVILRNNTQDASSMRERISMLLFRRLGIAAEREAFATLYVNNAYAGLYTIVESIDKDFAQRNFNDNDGYIYEYQYADPYYFEDRGRNPATYVPSPFEPQTHEDDPQPEKVGDLVQAINHAADFAAEMAQYLDLRTFIRHMAVLTFLADYDGFLGDFGMNNFYLYRFQNRNLFIIIPWDKSQALSSPTYSIWHNIRDVPGGQMNRLMTGALASPGLTSLYLDTLLESVASATEPGATDTRGWLLREIDRENLLIRDAVFADPVKNYTNEQYDGEVSKLREWAQQRGPFVTAEVNASR